MSYKFTNYWPKELDSGAFVNPEANAAYIQWLAQGNTPLPPDPLPTTAPSSITMRQARLALLNAGLLDAVNAGMATMPQAVQIEWEFASTVDRASPQVALLATALSLDDSALDALFTAGAAL